MRVTVWAKPGAARPSVGGERAGALVVAVRERAVEGRATRAVLEALADALGCRSRDLRLVSGTTSRTKIVDVPAEYGVRIAELRDGAVN